MQASSPIKDKFNQMKNVQSARQIRFTHADDVTKKIALLKAYIYEANEVEKYTIIKDIKTEQYG